MMNAATPLFVHNLILILLILYSGKLLVASEDINCDVRVQEGQCVTNPSYMRVHCLIECTKWNEHDTVKFRRYTIQDEAKDALYDLQLENATGHPIRFEQFEGYVTVIIPIAKSCHGSKVPPKVMFDSIQDIKKVWPYAVEILVFSYPHPSMTYSDTDCTEFETEYRNDRRGIHMMKESQLGVVNNDGLPSHPRGGSMFEILGDIMGVSELNVYTTQYYVISPDFDSMEYHYGKSLLDLKDVLHIIVKEELESSRPSRTNEL